jgi:hypothetical protein
MLTLQQQQQQQQQQYSLVMCICKLRYMTVRREDQFCEVMKYTF